MDPAIVDVAEQARLNVAREAQVPWKKWGPYLSERQWGTVREDYSEDGNAWNYFTHDQARSRAYRWGEDGLGGLCDDRQLLCFALALWNERDPILKERLFGLTNSEGNHGEDVKEYYFYLDSTPTHSYMKYLYKYPQREFPYRDLVETNRNRSREEFEYELLDTGIFDGDRYFDVFVEYAKAGPEDVLVRITVHNRGPELARLRVLPTLWFRNTWSWGEDARKPSLRQAAPCVVQAAHPDLGEYWLHCDGAPELLFTENESNAQRLWGQPNASPYVKDAFHAWVISRQAEAVNPARAGTKAAAHYALELPAGGSTTVRLRLSANRSEDAFGDFEKVFASRIADADEFYQRIVPRSLTEDQRRVHRQAMAGVLWGKQYYYFDLERWLREHRSHPLQEGAVRGVRNMEWFHMLNADVISMPDKWEYPWYAAWDLAFHTITLAQVDFDFAKEQLLLMLRNLYFHPSGQIPAYEWNFSDVNPPVHAWATLWLYKYEKQLGREDRRFLEHSFHGLMLNFNWWVNRKDPAGRNVFAGGFLGLDNIGIFDRSAPLPTGGSLEQADGTAWMAFYCQSMLEIALVLAETDTVYEEIAFKFVQHFMWIAYAMDRRGEHRDEMWDEQDGFFYDLLRLPDGRAMRLKVRSLVGLLPLCASAVIEPEVRRALSQADGDGRAVPRSPSGAGIPGGADGSRLHRPQRAPAAVDPQPAEARARARLPARRERVPRAARHPLALAPSPGTSVRVPCRWPGIQGAVPAGRIEHRHVRRQLQLARPGMDAGQCADRPGAGEPVRLLRRRVHGRMPDRLGAPHDSVRSGAGDRAPADQHFPARRQRPAAGLRRNGPVPGRSALARPHPVLRVLPRRQRRRPRRQSPDGMDLPDRPPAGPVRPGRRQSPARGRARQRAGPGRSRTGRRRAGENALRSGHGRSTLPGAVPDRQPRRERPRGLIEAIQ